MSCVTIEVAGGGLVAAQPHHGAPIGEQGVAQMATTAAGVHILKETTAQRATLRLRATAHTDIQSAVV